MTTNYYFRNMGPNTRWLLEPDTSSGAVQSIDNYDITGDGVKDLIIGKVYKWFSFPYTEKSPFEDFKLFWLTLTLVRDVWYLTLWTDWQFSPALLGLIHFGPCTIRLNTIWPVNYWLLTFGTEWCISLSQFGPVMLWACASWPKTNWAMKKK